MPSPISAQRIKILAGASNFRDWGAYATQTGHTIAAHTLFRSAQLGGVTSEGAEAFRALGIRTIVDLRGPRERLTALPHFAHRLGVEVVSCPIVPGSGESIRSLARRKTLTSDDMRDVMSDVYRSLVRNEKPAVGAALRAILHAAERPLVVHCTAGKDRTGFVVAVVLSLLGVSRATVLQDYLLTNEHWDRAVVGYAELPAEATAVLLSAEPAFLEAAFTALENDYGDVETFAATATGLHDYAKQLRACLLVPSK